MDIYLADENTQQRYEEIMRQAAKTARKRIIRQEQLARKAYFARTDAKISAITSQPTMSGALSR